MPVVIRVCVLASGLLAGGGEAAGAEPRSSQTTLQSLLQEGIHLFGEGKYGAADGAFDELESVFGREAEYRDRAVQRVIQPMRGYAALVVGDAAGAIEQFRQFLDEHEAVSEKKRAFVLFALGQALQLEGDRSGAIACYKEYIAGFPTTAEAGVAQLRIAELQWSEGEATDALDSLDGLFASEQSFTLRQEARLRALQIAAQGDDHERAVRYLLETDWQIEGMAERAVLAFAALRLGDALLREERFDEAIAAYRLVPSRESLLAHQSAWLEDTRRTIARRARLVATESPGIWSEYYRQLLARLEAQLEQIETSESYTGPLYLRYAQAFAGAGRYYEAWLVFAELAEGSEFPDTVRQEAHYRWIAVVQALQKWQDALEVARSFAERYPEAPRAPLVLFLNANAHQQLGDYETAVDILTRLLAQYPNHPFHGRWQFTRGFNRLVLEAYADARGDFAAYGEAYPETALAKNAALWHALAWFFEKAYEPALKELDELLTQIPPDHHLRPAVAYRRGCVLYAQREYEPALEQIDEYLAAFPEDRHRAEALVLRGDILMGLGRLLPAALAFRQVGPEAGALFPYAVFQSGKVYRAMEDYDRLAKHFEDYVAQNTAPPRVSEALYWIGWAREKQGRTAEALPVFAEALERYGNDPEATDMTSILGALHQVHQKLENDFMAWLRREQEDTRAAGELTAFARLKLYEATRLEAAREKGASREVLLRLGETVPRAVLDAEGLGRVGLAWQAAGRDEAEAFFTALLERYPHAPQRASAYLGQGRLAFSDERYADAAEWLRRIVEDLPTHPHSVPAGLLYGRTLVYLGEPDAAVPVLEAILQRRGARGRPHAEALLVLAQAAEADARPDAAVAYYQRVYNLYRAYPDLVGTAYLRSAELFEARGDLRAAWRTYREVLAFEELTDADVRARAKQDYERLHALLPPEPGIEMEMSEQPEEGRTEKGGEA